MINHTARRVLLLDGKGRKIALLCWGILAISALCRSSSAGSIFDDDFTPPKGSTPANPPDRSALPPPPNAPSPATQPDRAAPPATQPANAPDNSANAAAPATAQPTRLPVPGKAEQAKSRQLFKKAYATELLDRTAAGRKKLAETLLSQASTINDSPNDQFVLLAGAIDAGREAGSLDIACQAADRMGQAYDVDAVQIKAATALNTQLHAGTDSPDNVQAALTLVDELISASDITTSLRILQLLKPLASDPALSAEIQARNKRVEILRMAATRVAPSLQKLEQNPNDPAANLAAGEYYCFILNDWARGLPCLAKGDKTAVSTPAKLELTPPTDGDGQIKVGDAWWDGSSKENGPNKDAMRKRAVSWYSMALENGNIAGLQRVIVEKKVAEVQSAESTAALNTSGLGGHISVLNATYGIEGKTISVTRQIQRMIDADPFTPLMTGAYLGDPAPGQPKELTISYRVGSKTESKTIAEHDFGVLPEIPSDGLLWPKASTSFQIVAARFGNENRWTDVTQQVRAQIIDPTREVELSRVQAKTAQPTGGRGKRGANTNPRQPGFGGPPSNRYVIWFDYKGRRYVRDGFEGSPVTLIPN